MALKKGQQRELLSGQISLFPDAGPQPKFRAVMVVPNQAAKDAGLYIHPNMEVPAESVVMALHADSSGDQRVLVRTRENLKNWRHSDGTCLRAIDVHVEAQHLGEQVVAIMHPAAQ
jgi:hypothetical protein